MTEPEPVINDRRRIDPETGEVRRPVAAPDGPESCCGGEVAAEACCCGAEPADSADACCGGVQDGACCAEEKTDACSADGVQAGGCCQDAKPADTCCAADVPTESCCGAQAGGCCADGDPSGVVTAAEVVALQAVVEERTLDLQRLQAEYANYKKRVDRDRALSRQAGIENVVLDLLPVLDSVEAAREHDELVGGFKLVADELAKVTAKYGLESFGAVGDPFDPRLHEALMRMPMPDATEVAEATVSAVMQKGVLLHERILRPARVGVANPPEDD